MDLFFFFFKLAPALQFIFKMSHIPQPEDFKELTPDQYAAFYRKAGEEDLKDLSGKKLLAFLPDDIKVYNRVIDAYGDNLVIIGEDEYDAFRTAAEYIDKCCNESGQTFNSLTDKLSFMAKQMPTDIIEGTPYAIHAAGQRKREE